MDMAHLPATVNPGSGIEEPDPVDAAIGYGLSRGMSIGKIARRIKPDGDPDEMRRLRARLRRRVRNHVGVSKEVALLAHEEILSGVGPTVRGLVYRASSGHSDAAKVVLELAGLWQPTSRHQHDHSGEVDIRLHSMPRPKAVDSTAEED